MGDSISRENKVIETNIQRVSETHIQDYCEARNDITKDDKIHKDDTNLIITTKKEKQYIFPTSTNYEILKTGKYRIVELKKIAKKYKLKVSGKKQELITRIYDFLSTYQKVCLIQSVFKGYIVRKFFRLHGPCIKQKMRDKCVNDTDFMTLESIHNLDYNQLFSYVDEKGFYYAFDICSLYNLFKSLPKPFNPYTRDILKPTILENLKEIIRYSVLLNQPISIDIKEDETVVTDPHKLLDLQIERIFQKMDDLGNYTNSDWLRKLNRDQYIRYLRELHDIWIYRAQLLPETKQDICPPNGDPFIGINLHTLHIKSDIFIKQTVVNIIEKIITNGINQSSRSLGCFYALASLTLVNNEVAQALPWLYESVVHFPNV